MNLILKVIRRNFSDISDLGTKCVGYYSSQKLIRSGYYLNYLSLNQLEDHSLSLMEIEEVLSYFSTSIFSMNSKEDIAWNLAQNCISRLHFEHCVIYFVDYDRKVLVQTAALGSKNPVGREILDPIEIPLGMGVTGFVAVSGTSRVVPKTLEEPLYIQDDKYRMSEITIPIKVDGQVVWIIDCENSEEDYFTDEHKRVLEAIASICSIKLGRMIVNEI